MPFKMLVLSCACAAIRKKDNCFYARYQRIAARRGTKKHRLHLYTKITGESKARQKFGGYLCMSL